MKRFLAVFIIGGLALLSACGGDKPPITPPAPPITPPPAGLPNAPTQFIAFGSSTTTITLAWTTVKDATGYSLERKAAGTDAFVPVAQVDGQTASLLDQSVSSNVMYAYRIRALNAQGASSAVEQQAKTNADEVLQTQNEPPIGQPEQQFVGVQGGTISSLGGQITIQIPPGSVPQSTQITLQAFTNPVEGNPAPGIEISSSAPFTQPINVSFQYSDEDAADPKNLAMALQEPDGTWIAQPYNLNEAARTITLTIPPNLLSQTRISAQVAPRKSAKVLPLRSTFVTPKTASLGVKKTLQLSAFGAFSDYDCDTPELADQVTCTIILLAVNPNATVRPVNRAIKPLQNNLAGWERYWTINLIEGGSSAVGTVVKSGVSGAVYTAPDKKPSSNPVQVRFHSIKVSGKTREAAIPVPANIKIEEVVQTYKGSVKFNGSNTGGTRYTGEGDNITWNLIEYLPDDLAKYEASGSLQVTTTYPDCTPVTASVPVEGTMIVYDSVRGGQVDPFASKYWFVLQQGATLVNATTQCGKPPTAQSVPVTFYAAIACSEVPTLPTAPKYADIALLESSGSWPCSINTTTANWSFKAQ